MSPADRGLVWALAALILWSSSALVTSQAVAHHPPLTMVAASFSVASLAGLAWDAWRGRLRRTLVAPPAVVALGLYGVTSYYLAYYFAFAAAPRVEVNLLNYLWPLLTVLLSAPLLRQPLPPRALPAALVGLLGAGLVITQGQVPQLAWRHALGYALALWAGLSWAVFSCLLRRLGPVAAGRMPLFCALTALVSWLAAAGVRPGGLPPDGWLAALYLGLGPLWLAFHCWDHALQLGDVARIGLLSYLCPALSTLLLAAAGAPLTGPSAGGLVLIVGAALLGTGTRRRPESGAIARGDGS